MSARAACRCRRSARAAGLIPGSYDIPAATLRAMAVYTNTMPTQAYRSSGRPEVTFAIERLIDNAAARARLRPHRAAPQEPDQAERDAVPQRGRHALRQRPLRREHGLGDGASPTGRASTQRRREAKKRGRLLGLGLANYVESSIGAPNEQARITVRPGRPRRRGDRHAAERAGPRDELRPGGVRPARACRSRRVKIILGDTDVVKVGGGIAFRPLDAPCRHRVLQGGRRADRQGQADRGRRARHHARRCRRSATAGSASRDTNRSFDFLELAREAARHALPDDLTDGLAVVTDNEMHEPVFPNGCAICEVEIDPDTGDDRRSRATPRSTTSAAASIR